MFLLANNNLQGGAQQTTDRRRRRRTTAEGSSSSRALVNLQGGEIEMLQINKVANFTATKIVQSGPDTFVLAGWRMDSSRRVHELRVFRIEPSKTHLPVTTEERVRLPNANMHERDYRHPTSDGTYVVVPEGKYGRKVWKRLGEETWKWYTTVQFDIPIVNVVSLSRTNVGT